VTRRSLTRAPVNLSSVAQSVADELKQSAPDRDVDFSISPDVHVSGDEGLLRIALQNLMGNSWKFTAKRERAKIEFNVAENNGMRAYFVRDNGAGFDMAYADKLFQPFTRLHRESEFAGTGIGLATVQRIIHRHGGRIWAEGAVDKGATAYFTLQNDGESP
jgi:light-regulated signal transduction histidine kinase (bacteriophytochrome)